MAYAQSAPGVSTSRKDTAQKASTDSTLILVTS